jgi:RNA polymerase sigma factor (sigma-70 family)
MTGADGLAERFEALRPRLRGVAHRLLGSRAEAEDVVQESWLRLGRVDADAIDDLGAWLTTVVARQALDVLRARRSRPEEPLELRRIDPVIEAPGPESEALTADAVGLALLVVLEALSPPERLAYVLHDLFAIPFDEVARVVDRSPEATRQLASRARRRVAGERVEPEDAPATQHAVVEAFFRASREGDFDALVEVLDPDVVLREDAGPGPLRGFRGAVNVARGAIHFRRANADVRPALINGVPGAVTFTDGVPKALAAFTVAGGRVVAMDVLTDPDRIARLDLSAVT